MVGKLTPNNMLSASRAAQLEGLSPYGTNNELLSEMIAIDEGRLPEPWDGNELTFWGDTHEPVIINETAKRLDLCAFRTQIDEPYFHPTLKLACSLDGDGRIGRAIKADAEKGIYMMNTAVIDDPDADIIMECKTTQAAAEDVPPPWRGPIQLQAQMMCTGAKYGVVAVLYRGSTLRLFVYEADPVMQKRISDSVVEF